MVDRTLSHYHILDRLGAGGMAEMYVAEDIRLGRRVALKLLPPSLVRIVNRALAKDGRARYQQAEQMLADLGACRDRLKAAGPQAAGAAVPRVPSIAVLPFANLSPDPGQEYFCDGMTEELITALGAIEGLRAGRRDAAREVLGELIEWSARESVSPVWVALIHDGLGEAAGGIAVLERGMPDWGPAYVLPLAGRSTPALQSHPGLREILKGLGYKGPRAFAPTPLNALTCPPPEPQYPLR